MDERMDGGDILRWITFWFLFIIIISIRTKQKIEVLNKKLRSIEQGKEEQSSAIDHQKRNIEDLLHKGNTHISIRL